MFTEIQAKDNEYVIQTYGRVEVAIESGTGSIAKDVNGKYYIDFSSGVGVNSLGYCHPRWVEAITIQANKLQHISNYYYSSVATELAEILAKISGMSKMFFGNTGCEANECAIKIARKAKQKTGAYKIISLKNSFHGRTITTLAANGQEIFHKDFLPLTEGFKHCDGDQIDELKGLIDEEVCAIIIECVQGEGGVVPFSTEFIIGVRELCNENKILMIVDEVQTGIGRTGKYFAYQKANVLPDVATIAKGLGGGLPIGVCLVNEEYQDVLELGDHGSTFGANPVACAGALAVLEEISKKEFMEDVEKKGKYIIDKLNCLETIELVRGEGLMIGVKPREKSPKEVMLACADNGLLVLTAKDVVRLLPPLNITYEEIDKGIEILISQL